MVDLTAILKDLFRMKPITKESVERARAKGPKRICPAAILVAGVTAKRKHLLWGNSFSCPQGFSWKPKAETIASY